MHTSIPIKHEIWLWLWFSIGMGIYMLKRAYFLVTGPNPVANSYTQFVERCWIPLLVRTSVDAGIYWFCFTPQILDQGLTSIGWSKAAYVVAVVTQFAVCAFFFGLAVDSTVDLAVTKVPIVKDWLPQMPPPLKSQP